MNEKKETKQPRKRHVPSRLKLSDSSAHPGPQLLDRLSVKRPDMEARAIQEAWRFRFPVTVVASIPTETSPQLDPP